MLIALKRVEGRRRSERFVNGHQRFSKNAYRRDTDTSLTELGACATIGIERSESSLRLPKSANVREAVQSFGAELIQATMGKDLKLLTDSRRLWGTERK